MRRRPIIAIGACLAWSSLSAAPGAPPSGDLDGAALTERAEAALASVSSDGADTASLFGVPTVDQARRARAAAAEALDAARAAEGALDRAVAAITRDPAFADNRALQDERSRLAVEYRLIRLPAAKARAAAILAALADARAQRDADAREALQALAAFEPASPESAAAARALRASLGMPPADGAALEPIVRAARDAARADGWRSAGRRREVVVAGALALDRLEG
ncbi:MAG: hypothetical protein D6693_08690, partial [Planctomycetota bacterium]